MYSNLASTPTKPALRPLRGRAARGGVLVLGGGFAGAYVARKLGRGGATIVNPTNFMLYTPLLPEAAAGNIEPRHVVVPIRTMCPHADLVLGHAVALDPERRVVEVQSEAGRIAISYEKLVVALGSVTRTPAVPGLREHALGLKDLRPGSPSEGDVELLELSADEYAGVVIPAGVAHGLYARTDALVLVALTAAVEEERGCAWNDPGLGIDWPAEPLFLSERDQRAGALEALRAEVAALY